MKSKKLRLTAAFLTVFIMAFMIAPLTAQAATRTDVIINNSVNGLNVNISYDDFMLIGKLYPGERDSSVMTIRNTRFEPFTLSLQIVEVHENTSVSKPNIADKVNLKVTSGGDTLLETRTYKLWKDPDNNANTARIPISYKLYGNVWADTRDEADDGSLKAEPDRLYPVYPDENTEMMGGLLNTNQTYLLGSFNNIRNLSLDFEASMIPETDNAYQGAEANFQVIFTIQTSPPIPTNPPPEVPETTSPETPVTPPDDFVGPTIGPEPPLYEPTVIPPTPTTEIQSIIESPIEEYIPEEEEIPEEPIPLEVPTTERIPSTLGSSEDETEEITESDIPLSGLPVTGGIALTGLLIAGIAFIILGKVIERKNKTDTK